MFDQKIYILRHAEKKFKYFSPKKFFGEGK
jgi:hypothetical protein